MQTLSPETGLQLAGRTLVGARFEAGTYKFLDLEGVKLVDCDLSNCVWERARLVRVEMRGCRLTGFELLDSKADGIALDGCRGQYVQVTRSELKQAVLTGCELVEATFTSVRMLGAVFQGCDLRRSVWSDCNLHGADLRGCDTGGVRANLDNFAGAVLDPAQAGSLLHAAYGIRVLAEGEPLG